MDTETYKRLYNHIRDSNRACVFKNDEVSDTDAFPIGEFFTPSFEIYQGLGGCWYFASTKKKLCKNEIHTIGNEQLCINNDNHLIAKLIKGGDGKWFIKQPNYAGFIHKKK